MLFGLLQFRQQLLPALGFRFRQVVECINWLGWLAALERLTIRRTGDRLPFVLLQADFDAVADRHAIRVFSLSIARPFDSVDTRRRGQFDLHPAGIAGGDPAFGIAVLAVVDVRELVQRMFKIPSRTRLGALAGQREIFVAGKNFQLINARLAGGAAGDVKTHKPRLHGRERIDVMLGRHRRSFALVGRRDEFAQLRFQFPNPLLQGRHLSLGGVVER